MMEIVNAEILARATRIIESTRIVPSQNEQIDQYKTIKRNESNYLCVIKKSVRRKTIRYGFIEFVIKFVV